MTSSSDTDPPPRQRIVPAVVEGTATPTTPEDLNAVRAGEDRSRFINHVLEKWSNQQDADRTLRKWYAGVLIAILFSQVVPVNVAFFQIGRKALAVDEWTARVFIMAVFGELAAMVFFIVKYLFRSTGDEIIKQVGQMAAEAVPRRDVR